MVPIRWQEEVEKKGEKVIEKKESQAFLWIPAEAKQIRGVLMAGLTRAEQGLVKDPVVRKACAEQGLAIVFTKCGLATKNVDLQNVLNDLAKTSGYPELSVAPLAFAGHSAGGPQAREMAVKYADRCFGLMQYRGGPPWDSPVKASTPSLMMVGEFDEYGGTMRNPEGVEHWERTMNKLGDLRKEDPTRLWSMIVEPGAGHFPWSDRNAAYFSLWIKKAAAAKIPQWQPDSKDSPKLLDVDASKGWVTDLAIKTEKGAYPATTAGKENGNWHFDEELAKASVAYEHPDTAASFLLKDQFIKWNDPYWVDAGTRFFFTSMKWVDDGQTLEVHPVYRDEYPKEGAPKWPQAGTPVGHSSSPILVKPGYGPVVAASGQKVRVQFDNLSPASEGARFYFVAYSNGDKEYRYTEQVGMADRAFTGIKNGKDQTITFPEIGTVSAAKGPVQLKATSDSGLPVEFYVGCGPAEVVDGKLVIKEVPARATWPLQITVVAYQFGSGMKPEVKSAKPVEQVVTVTK
jgi:hypothetical protein